MLQKSQAYKLVCYFLYLVINNKPNYDAQDYEDFQYAELRLYPILVDSTVFLYAENDYYHQLKQESSQPPNTKSDIEGDSLGKEVVSPSYREKLLRLLPKGLTSQ